jgi:hypothetical protein
MTITVGGSNITFNDATTQTTAPVNTNANVNSVSAGTGISVSATTGALTVTNAGVTSAVAGTNVTVSGSTGAVTINASAYPLTSGTAQNTTSGTSFDFTSIPSWVKRITVMFNGVSTNGSANILIQLGSSSIQTTGYTSTVLRINAGSTSGGTSSTQGLMLGGDSASFVSTGIATLTLVGSNVWVGNFVGQGNSSTGLLSGVTVTLSGTLDRVSVTTTNGTDAFDLGSLNVLWE